MDTKELKGLIDQWGTKRRERLAEQKKVDRIEVDEKKLKAQIIAAMSASGTSSIGASHSGANYTKKDKPTAGDWMKIYAWIKDNDSFDILQKRLTDTAVMARVEDGIEIPGIVMFPVEDITLFTP